jgi:hypothetical protein
MGAVDSEAAAEALRKPATADEPLGGSAMQLTALASDESVPTFGFRLLPGTIVAFDLEGWSWRDEAGAWHPVHPGTLLDRAILDDPEHDEIERRATAEQSFFVAPLAISREDGNGWTVMDASGAHVRAERPWTTDYAGLVTLGLLGGFSSPAQYGWVG